MIWDCLLSVQSPEKRSLHFKSFASIKTSKNSSEMSKSWNEPLCGSTNLRWKSIFHENDHNFRPNFRSEDVECRGRGWSKTVAKRSTTFHIFGGNLLMLGRNFPKHFWTMLLINLGSAWGRWSRLEAFTSSNSSNETVSPSFVHPFFYPRL